MNKNRLLVAVSVLTLLLPVGIVSAKTSMTLQKLSSIVQNNTRPMEFDLKAEGSYDGYSAEVTVHGVQGATDSNKSLETAFSATIDAEMKEQGSAHLDFDVKVVGQNAYVRVKNFTMKNGEAMGIDPSEYTPYLNTWIRFPIDASVAEQLSAKGRLQRTTEAKRYAPYFDIVETDVDGMRRYVLSIPPAKQRRLLMMITAKKRGYYSPKLNAEARKNIRNMTLAFNFNGVIDLLADGLLASSSIRSTVATKFNDKTATFSLEFVSDTVTAPIITAPTDSKLWEEMVDENPVKDLENARNAQRRSDVNAILKAVYTYDIENHGRLPITITSTETEICHSQTDTDCSGLVNLDILIGSYIARFPSDPQAGSATSTKYTIFQKNGRVTVSAPHAEGGEIISMTR